MNLEQFKNSSQVYLLLQTSYAKYVQSRWKKKEKINPICWRWFHSLIRLPIQHWKEVQIVKTQPDGPINLSLYLYSDKPVSIIFSVSTYICEACSLAYALAKS